MSRSTSGLTRAPMSSISATAANATTQAAVASVPTTTGSSPWLGSRTSRKRPTPYPTAVSTSEDAPIVVPVSRSSSRPALNPVAEPATLPP